MNCESCNIEMPVQKVENKIFTFYCRKCNKVIIKTEEELKLQYENKNKIKEAM